MKTITIRITGIVQGVFFRAHTEEQAKMLGIKGWVKNKSNGSVFVYAQGDEKELEKLIEWCHVGPSIAKVENVEVEEIETNESFTDFSTRY